MLIRLKLASHPRGEGTPAVFPALLPPARPRTLPLAYSVAIHAAVLSLLPVVTQYGMASSARTDLSRYKVEMLPLRVPLYFPDAAAPAPSARRSSAAAKKSGAPERERNTASAAVVAPPRAVKPFELPAPAVRAKNTPLILQPDPGPAVQPSKPLPSMAFWARLGSAPKRPVREFVTPGRTEQPAPTPKLDAPPVLAVPNRQPKPGDVNFALSSTPARPVRLFVSNSSTVPVRLQQDGGASEAASLDAAAGEAANLIVLGGARPPAALTIEVPKGLSQGPPEAGRAASGAAAGASGAASGKQAGASGATANDASTAESGRAAANGPGNQNSQSRSAGAAGRASGSGSNGAGPVLPPPAVGPSAPPPPIRITHSPAGSFDVVIAQSGATGGDLPDAAGMLTGNPIYTVYLRVGDEREWLLEYCLPGEKQVQSNPYEINVGPVVQVTPPYPLFTSIPGSVRQRRQRDHVVLHGYLTASGAFRDVKAADPSDALGREILALLGDWRFRPALRDRTPIGVEVLLVVPPRTEN